MKKEWKDKWVAALRSGEYNQGVGALKSKVVDDIYTYCCLGVLCDLVAKEQPERFRWEMCSIDANIYVFKDTLTNLEMKAMPPNIIANLVYDKFGGTWSRYIDMNDCMSHSFATIADYIEANE